MLQRHMVGSKQIEFSSNWKADIKYYITLKNINDIDTLYGVCIEKYDLCNGDYILGDSDTVDGVSYDRNETEEIVRTFINGEVTPVTMRYILEDLTKDMYNV